MMKLVVLFVFMASSMAWPTRFRRQADQTPVPASTCSYVDGAYSLTLAGDSGFCFGTVDLADRLDDINAKLAGIIAHHGQQHHDDHDDDDDEKMQSDQTQPQGADNTHAAQPTQQQDNSAAQQTDNSAAQQPGNSAAQQTDNSAGQQQETPSQAPTTKPAVTTTTTQKPTQAPTVAEVKVPEATEEVVVNVDRVPEETAAVVETKPEGESVPMQNAAATPVESE